MNLKRIILISFNLLLLNLLLWRGGGQWDVSEEGKHSLAPETPGLIQKLEGKVKIYLITSNEKQSPLLKPLVSQLKDFLQNLKENSNNKISIEFIDPYDDISKRNYVENHFGVKRMPVQLSDGTQLIYFSVVLESGSHSKVFNAKDLVYADPSSTRKALHLNDLEPLFLRQLFTLNRRYENFRQALAQAKGKKLKLIPIISEELEPYVQVRASLLLKEAKNLSQQFPDSLELVSKNSDDADIKKYINTAGLHPYPSVKGNKYYMHLLILKEDGELVQVPDLLTINSNDIGNAINERILLTLNKSENQLGLLLPSFVNSPYRDGPRKVDRYKMIRQYLNHHFQLRQLEAPLFQIPQGIKTLVVMGIDKFENKSIEALDRFVAKGGRLILFVDRHVTHFNLSTFNYELQPQDNGLEKLLLSWGVELNKEVGFGTHVSSGVAINWPKKVSNTSNRLEMMPVAHAGLPLIQDLPKDLSVLKGVKSVLLSYPNSISLSPHKNHRITALLPSKSNRVTALPIGDWVSPLRANGSLNTYVPPQQHLDSPKAKDPLFAVLLEGQFHSVESDHADQLSPNTRIAVIGDSDFLSNDFYLGPQRGSPSPALQGHLYLNQVLVRNLVDWSFGDDALLKVSSRQIKIRQLDTHNKKRAEIIAVSIPVLILLLIGFWRWSRRRRA